MIAWLTAASILFAIGASISVVVILFVKAPRAMTVFSVMALLAAGAGWKILERSFRLDQVPDALEVREILYAKEESWGFGPGGNEAGIIVYSLPDNIAKAINAAGLRYFANLPPNRDEQRRGWRGSFSNWEETPVKAGPHWKPDPASGRYKIGAYVCAYVPIEIDALIRQQAADAVNNPGSYYAYGRIGIIVVTPKSRRVFFMYNG